MIVIDGKEYRNLEEQVLKNMEDIETLKEEQIDILNEDNTFEGNNTFNGNLYRPNPNGGGQLIVNNVMAGISFSDDGDQTGQIAVTSAGASITGLVSPVNDNDAANKYYVDNAINGIDLSNYLPLTGGTLIGDLSITNYKKLKFTDNSYFQNQANTRTALYGDLKMENGNIILGTGLSINPPANPTTFNGIEVKGSVRLNDGLLYMNNKRIVSVATPSQNDDAANKKYVDDQIATIDTSNYVQKTNQQYRVYGTGNAGDTVYAVSNSALTAGYVPIRNTNGNLRVPTTPDNSNDAASKAYVDSVATAAGSTYTVQVESNTTPATVFYGWKQGKMITFYGKFNDGLNSGANFVNVASTDTISHGYIQSGDNVMAFGNINNNTATFDEEAGATTGGSAFNGRNFVGVIWLV